MRIAILAGGVGGARMARGFVHTDGVEVTVIVNVADDDVIYGLDLSPDIDTVIYTLAGVEGEHGWGRANETWTVMDEMAQFEVDTSFRLGDRDLALNVFRTAMLRDGHTLSSVTASQSRRFSVPAEILPASDDRVRTMLQIEEDESWIDFQTYFVRRKHVDRIIGIRYDGIDSARPAPGVLDAIHASDAVILAPSNPFLSIIPILSIGDIRQAVSEKAVMAVSPFIGGQAIKGPAADLMRAFGHEPTPSGLEAAYAGLIDHLVVDPGDEEPTARARLHSTDILIRSEQRASHLAVEMIEWLN